MTPTLFTPAQLKWLRTWYPHWEIPVLTVKFNVKFDGNKTEAQIRYCTKNHKIKSGHPSRFSKGHKPWNAGTKGQGLTTRNRGTFSNGHIPANRKPVGSERVDVKDDYILIKIAERDPHTGFPTRYKAKHVVLWEKKHGPTPKGSAIIFKDSNKRNFKSSNLICITRAELARLNQMDYKHQPAQVKPSVFALAKLKTVIGKSQQRTDRARPVSTISQEERTCQQ
jgi:hypothetical protein